MFVKLVTCRMLAQCFVLMWLPIVQIKADECLTPNNETAQCISLFECSVLLRALANQNSETIDFIRQSHCGKWNHTSDPKVCCGSKQGFIRNVKASPRVPGSKQFFPNRRYCGYQHTDDYFVTGNETSIDEYPWLAIFIHKPDEDLDLELIDSRKFAEYGCGGTLINARYVLTAAQCLRLKFSSAVAVRLGEYNILKDSDCTAYQDLDDCSDPVEEIPIEKNIMHPQYSRQTGVNDIALTRLNKTVFFTDYVRPICLPTPGTQFAIPGDILISTGFGDISDSGGYAVVKKKVVTSLITNEECNEYFEEVAYKGRTLTDKLMCTMDFSNNTEFVCSGDSGSPLMISRRSQWHIEGFVVWGTNICGSNYPMVHVKVARYLDWIEANMQPW